MHMQVSHMSWQAVRCLRALNKSVIEQASESATLFRGNSLAAKVRLIILVTAVTAMTLL